MSEMPLYFREEMRERSCTLARWYSSGYEAVLEAVQFAMQNRGFLEIPHLVRHRRKYLRSTSSVKDLGGVAAPSTPHRPHAVDSSRSG